MHPDARARARARGTRRPEGTRRPRLGRLGVVVLFGLVGSGVVTVIAETALPERAPAYTAEPRFDAKAFYLAHPALANAKERPVNVPARAAQEQPKPAGGLTQAQMDNAYIIVAVGRQMQLPPRAYVVAIATALQESNLRNLANSDLPESLRLPHEGVGDDHDSVGLFQQRPSMGWGTIAQLMDPAQAAARFYTRLARVDGWQGMTVTGAAQAVQRSAYPDAYAKHGDRAQKIVDTMP